MKIFISVCCKGGQRPTVSIPPPGFAAFAAGENKSSRFVFSPAAARIAGEPEGLKGGKPAGQIRDGVPKNGTQL
jgi:hypothetical protein